MSFSDSVSKFAKVKKQIDPLLQDMDKESQSWVHDIMLSKLQQSEYVKKYVKPVYAPTSLERIEKTFDEMMESRNLQSTAAQSICILP